MAGSELIILFALNMVLLLLRLADRRKKRIEAAGSGIESAGSGISKNPIREQRRDHYSSGHWGH